MKRIISTVVVCLNVMLFLPIVPAYAKEINSVVLQEVDDEIDARADVIVTKFRNYHGILQYRRWNETRGVWVDPEWINA